MGKTEDNKKTAKALMEESEEKVRQANRQVALEILSAAPSPEMAFAQVVNFLIDKISILESNQSQIVTEVLHVRHDVDEMVEMIADLSGRPMIPNGSSPQKKTRH